MVLSPGCDAVMVQLPVLAKVTVADDIPLTSIVGLPAEHGPDALKLTCCISALPPASAVAVTVMVLTRLTSAGGLMVCWGTGAAVGATVFLLRTGYRPWRGRPTRWAAETRHLSGWFTATALIGQGRGPASGSAGLQGTDRAG